MEKRGEFAWFLVLKGLFLFILGLFFVFNPGLAIKTFAFYVGLILLAVALFDFWNTYRIKKLTPDLKKTYISPVISLIAGLVLMFFAEYALTIIAFAIGVVILIDGFGQIKRGDELTTFDKRLGNLLLIAGALSIVLAVIIVFNPYSLVKFMTVLVGLSLSISGAFLLVLGISSRS